MKTFIISFFFLTMTAVHAAPKTCSELEVLYKSDSISHGSDTCTEASCRAVQFLQIRALADLLDPTYDPAWADDFVYRKYGPGFSQLQIAGEKFDVQGISLPGDEKYYLFKAGTTTLSSMVATASDSGPFKLTIHGKQCSSPLSPYLSSRRKQILCEMVGRRLQSTDPQLNVTVGVCLDSKSKFGFETEDFESNSTDMMVMRKLGRDKYFLCKANLQRKTDTFKNLKCFTSED